MYLVEVFTLPPPISRVIFGSFTTVLPFPLIFLVSGIASVCLRASFGTSGRAGGGLQVLPRSPSLTVPLLPLHP